MVTKLLRTECQRCPELRISFREERPWRHHANHCVGFVVERNALADDPCVTAESPAPQFVAEQHHMIFAVNLFLWKKVASQNGLDVEQSEDVRRKTGTRNIFGLAFSGEDEAAKASRGEAFKHSALFPPFIQRGRRHPVLV